MRSPASKSHQQRLENIVGVVCKEHSRCTCFCGTSLERSKPKPSRARRDAAPTIGGMHVDNLKRNAQLRAQTRTVIRVGISLRTTKVVMDMHCTLKSRGVCAAAPCPCAEQQRSRVCSATEGDEYSIPPTDTAALTQRCACPHACARAPHNAAQSAIGGVHTLMLRRVGIGFANGWTVQPAACAVMRSSSKRFRRVHGAPQ